MGLQTTVLNDSTNQVSVHTLEQQLLSGGEHHLDFGGKHFTRLVKVFILGYS